MHIHVRHYAPAERIVLQVVDHTVCLVHHTFFILMLYAHLIAVSLAYRSGFISPGIPDMAVEIMNIIRLLLPYPEHFLRSRLKCSLPYGNDRKFLRKVIAVHNPKPLYGICGSPVFPVRADFFAFRTGAVFQNIPAHILKHIICHAHDLFLLILIVIPPT